MTTSIANDQPSSLWSVVDQTHASVVGSGLDSSASQVESHRNTAKVCVFELGTQRYALDVAAVGEVCPHTTLNPVPMAPGGVLGLHNLRGRALAVVDLAALLDLESDGEERQYDQVLVLLTDDMEVGARIHQVEAIEEVDLNKITPVDDCQSSAVSGVIELGPDRHATVLDPIDLNRRLSALSFQRRE